MKNICLSVVLIFAYTFSFAQEEWDLFGEWFLHYRTIDGINTYPPLTTSEDYNILLEFRLLPPDAGNPFIIESYGPTTTFYEGRFDLTDGIMEVFNVQETDLNCQHPPEVCSYFVDYNIDILFDPNTIIETGEHILSVELMGEDDDTILTIINNYNGERAVYGRQTLSVNSNTFLLSDIELKENPVDNFLSFTSNNLSNVNYEIYTITGKLLSNGLFSSNSIDVSKFQSGLYFLKISNDHNNLKILKFIKK